MYRYFKDSVPLIYSKLIYHFFRIDILPGPRLGWSYNDSAPAWFEPVPADICLQLILASSSYIQSSIYTHSFHISGTETIIIPPGGQISDSQLIGSYRYIVAKYQIVNSLVVNRYIVVKYQIINSLVVTGIQWPNIRQSTHWQLQVYSDQIPDS